MVGTTFDPAQEKPAAKGDSWRAGWDRPTGPSPQNKRGPRIAMFGWMTVFGVLAIGGMAGREGDAGRLIGVLFGWLFLVAWMSRTAGRRAW